MKGNSISILGYPDSAYIVELPSDDTARELKDMTLHMCDLQDAKHYLEAYSPENGDVINRALVYSAIVSYYKCFGSSECRHFPLLRDKVLAHYPAEATKVFEYYHNLRNKYIAHDGSKCTQAVTGIILDPEQEYPLVDIVNAVMLTEHTKEDMIPGLSSFLKLIVVTIEWVEKKIDGLCLALKKKYADEEISGFQGFKSLQIQVPENNNLFDRR